jgi:hypothetical protein
MVWPSTLSRRFDCFGKGFSECFAEKVDWSAKGEPGFPLVCVKTGALKFEGSAFLRSPAMGTLGIFESFQVGNRTGTGRTGSPRGEPEVEPVPIKRARKSQKQ